jgi:AcrR family transcriptional regulator
MAEVKSRRSEHAEDTRAAIVAAARSLFGERGYARSSLDEVAERARVTKGAVYHHFRGKEDLLRAVYEEVVRELGDRGREASQADTDVWDRVRTGSQAFLDAWLEPEPRRVLQEAQAVLGREYVRRVDTSHHLALADALRGAMDERVITRLPVEPLAHILDAAFQEAADLVAFSPDPVAARAEVGATVDGLLESLRLT